MNEAVSGFLEASGLTSESLKTEILAKCGLNLPNFDIVHKMDFGEEQMLFRIFIAKDAESSKYKPEKIKAIHRSAIDIEPDKDLGMDIPALEDQMRAIDWNNYFSQNNQNLPKKVQKEINNILLQLWVLDGAKNKKDNISINKLLQYKYWPHTVTEKTREDFKYLYEHERTYYLSNNKGFNAYNAYYSMSRLLEDFLEKLSDLKMEPYLREGLEGGIIKHLSMGEENFILSFYHNEPAGHLDFELPVSKAGKELLPGRYKIAFTPYPQIGHGVFNGIDTKELDAKMGRIDWHNDHELFIFHDEETPSLTSQADLVQAQIFELCKDPVASGIADQLMVKYWADATFFSDLMPQTAWGYFDGLPKIEREFDATVEMPVAVNLMQGRAAQAKYISTEYGYSDQWMRLNLEEKDGGYPIILTKKFSEEEVERQMKLIPIDDVRFYAIKKDLLKGGIQKARTSIPSTVLLKADPEHKGIEIYTPEMQRIHTNLFLDAGWKAPMETRTARVSKPKMQRIPPSDKNGKGHKR